MRQMGMAVPGTTFGLARSQTSRRRTALRLICWYGPGSVRQSFGPPRPMPDTDAVRDVVTSVICPLMVCLLAGCSTPSWLCYFPGGVKHLTLVTQPDTNTDRAIAVDLVFITQDLPAEEIGKLSARDYFIRRTQLLRDYPGAMIVRSWELAPEQLVLKADADPPCNLVQTYLFADYGTQGDHRATLDGAKAVEVTLGPDDLTVKQ